MTTTMSTPFWLFAANIALLGLGNGSFQAPNNTIVMNAVEPKDLGVAGGMNALARNLGWSLESPFQRQSYLLG